MTWAVNRLEELLGDRWLGRALNADEPPALVKQLIWAGGHVPAGIAVIEWALRLSQAQELDGHGDVRKDFRSDVREERALHTLAQLTLATSAMRLGARVELEPRAKQDTPPADVRIELDRASLVVEVVIRSEGAATRQSRAQAECLRRQLSDAASAAGVWIAGQLPRILTEEELEDLVAAAGRQARVRDRPAVWRRDEVELTIVPRAFASGALTGPPVTGDTLGLLVSAIRKKTSTMKGSGAPWLYLVAYTGLFGFTTWGRSPLSVKLRQLRDTLDAQLGDDRPAGVIVASAAGLALGEIAVAHARAGSACATRQAVTPMRARETLVLPFTPEAAEESREWVELAAAEADWLDWALARAELPSAGALLQG